MANTPETARDEAIESLSLDYTQFGYDTDAEFLAWVLSVVNRVIANYSAKVGSGWDLDNLNAYEAVLYETMARLIERRIGRAYSAAAESQDITVGPISIRNARSGNTLKEWGWNANMYHQRAAARLMAMGVGRRKAMLKVFGAPGAGWERLDKFHPVPFDG